MDFTHKISRFPLEAMAPQARELKGSVYRGLMPLQVHNSNFQNYYQSILKEKEIYKVILLTTEKVVNGVDIIKFYKESVKLVHFPIEDRTAPKNLEAFNKLLDNIYRDLKKEKNILIHCWAGKGRTGLVLHCLTKYILLNNNTKGQTIDTIALLSEIRKEIPGAVETEAQENFCNDFQSMFQNQDA